MVISPFAVDENPPVSLKTLEDRDEQDLFSQLFGCVIQRPRLVIPDPNVHLVNERASTWRSFGGPPCIQFKLPCGSPAGLGTEELIRKFAEGRWMFSRSTRRRRVEKHEILREV